MINATTMTAATAKPKLVLIHQHSYQLRYYRQLITANTDLFSARLAYYWSPRLPSLTQLSPDEIQSITAFQRRKLQLREKHNSVSDSLLAVRARYDTAAWLHYLRKTKPQVVVMWNGNNPGYRAATLAATRLNIETRFLENGPLPNTTTCDPQGVNADSSIPREPSFFEKYAHQAGNRPPFNPAVRQSLGTEPPTSALPENYIFAPFQVHEDSQLLAHSPRIGDMREFYQWLQRTAQSLPYPIVVKEHPSCKRHYNDLHMLDRNIIFANQHNTKTLIENSAAVVTINSTVGLEAIFLNKPVVTLGNAFYGFPPFAVHVATMAELAEALRATIEKPQQNRDCANGLRAWLEDEYLVQGDWREATPEHLRQMAKRLLPLTVG